MPTPFTQDNRFLELTTPLGKDVLLLQSFSVSEKVSAPYTIELETLYKGMVDANALLGQPITIKVKLDNGERYFHGIVNQLEIGDESERFRLYRLVAVPTLWLLTLIKDFDVFENKNAPDIIKQVLSKAGIQNRFDLTKDYTIRDHCVQFRETTFNFISRIMEEEGIFYFFEHSDGKHVMVVADAPQAFKTCPQQPITHYAPVTGPMGDDYITSWERTQELRSGKVSLYDFHFENSTKLFTTDVSTVEPVAANTKYRICDSPGRFTHQFNKIDSGKKSQAEGDKLTRVRMEEVESQNPMCRATSSCKAFSAGHRFTVKGPPKEGDYVITSIEHAAMQAPPYISGLESEQVYSNTFTCIPYGANFRPQRVAPKPVIVGPQTATVTDGPDKYSRVKVRFHWGQQLTSAWVRVAQRWAGPGWGTIYIPRVGHEVIIEFIDGDPDQPLIVGSLYNAQNMPPYELPANKTQSGIKTRSMNASGAQGGSADFNELRFEDKMGQEDIYFHAQKDFHRVVENNDDLKVENDQTIQIKKGKRDTKLDMGTDTLTISMGNHIRKISLGKSETEAMQSIELKVGQSSVKLDQMGVTIKGMMVKIEGTVMLETKGLMAKHEGSTMMIVKGAITMIN